MLIIVFCATSEKLPFVSDFFCFSNKPYLWCPQNKMGLCFHTTTSWLHHEKTKQKGLLDLSAGSGKWYRDLDNTNQTFELVSSMFSFQVFRCFGSFFQVLFQTAAHCMVNQGHALSSIFVWKLGEIVSQDSGSSSIAYEKKGTR